MAGNLNSDDDGGLLSEINITPLVDVVLVILVIFMITAPVMYQSAIKVQLPKAASGEKADQSPLNFTLTPDGQVSWNNEKLSWPQLEEKLKSFTPEKDQPAMISADESTPHGTVVRLMDLLRVHGLFRFALNVDSGS